MNNDRRKLLREIDEKLSAIAAEIEAIRDDEQEYYDVMPEGIQMSEKGEVAEAAISQMDEAMTAIEEACSAIGEATA